MEFGKFMDKKYYIQTYGCQSNIRDSEIMSGMLDKLGFVSTNNYKEADVLIVNTCSVRQKSEDKAFGWGKPLSKHNFKGKKQIRFVTGCMVGSSKGDRKRFELEKLQDRLSWANYLLGPDEEILIPEILKKEGLISDLPDDIYGLSIRDNKDDWTYVNISTGCDNFCSFCVVPYARGAEISRSKSDILEEIRNVVFNGPKKIMLLGQNVNSWGLNKEEKFALRSGSDQKIPFAQLLRDVHDINGVEKISFMSSNPFDFTNDLIETLSLPKIDRYLHMAIQSGNDEVLKKMNRRHNIKDLMLLIEKIKGNVPDIVLGTDIIVGFPGETDEQFMDTVRLFEKISFKVAFISMYSPREGTLSAKHMKDDIPFEVKRERHAYLTKVWKDSLKNNGEK